jgi:hypothetical protein
MKSRISIAVAALVALACVSVTHAQDLGGITGLGSLTPGNASNAAGVLEFCMTRNLVKAADAATMKDKLLAKAGGPEASQSDAYRNGASGVVNGSDGSEVDLTKLGSLESNLTQQACAAVLQHAGSLL